MKKKVPVKIQNDKPLSHEQLLAAVEKSNPEFVKYVRSKIGGGKKGKA